MNLASGTTVFKINSLLKKGGYFVFTTPNCHGFDMMVLGKDYKNVHAPCHINYFNTKSIKKLLSRAGFNDSFILTPGILDASTVIKQITDGTLTNTPSFIRHLLLDTTPRTVRDFQHFLQKHKLSGHMLVFARKTAGFPIKT